LSRRHVHIFASVAFCFVLCGPGCAGKEVPAPRVVDLAASDGTNLKATYFAAGRSGPGILLLHQCNQQRKVWDDLADRLAKSGFNVLTLDFRGFGESGGTPADKLSPREAGQIVADKWPGDVDSAFRYLVSQPGVSRDLIGAGGASCAVNQAIQLAHRHPEIRSLVLLSEGTDRNGRQFLRNTPNMPLFLAVANDDPDRAVVEKMQWIASLSSNPFTKLVCYSTGGHGVDMFAAHKDLPGTISAWFEKTLMMQGRAPTTQSREFASVESRLLDLTDQPDGGKQALKMYVEARRHDPKVVLFSEAVMNWIGYEHLQTRDIQEAIDLFKLNEAAYPDSPNVYDSLSDAYLASGQKNLARVNAKIALVLLNSDTTDPLEVRNTIKASCEQKLKQLGDTPQKPTNRT
jgi:dienelactone hydrolase